MKDQDTLFSMSQYTREHVKPVYCNNNPRVNSPVRNQIEIVSSCLDDLIPEDHQVRNIWNYVSQMNLSSITQKIQSTIGSAGRSAIDPKILLSLWVYALIEGIGSARVIDRYCTEHLAFKWLCGGVSVNYHTISDFRKDNFKEFDQIITETIARLMEKNLVTLKRVSQDGMRVKAAAGSSSCRRKPKLKELLVIAKEQLEILKNEIDADPAACLNRETAAKKRAAQERMERIEQAIEEHKKVIIEKGKSKKKQRRTLSQEEKDKIRISITDPTSRKMKMSNGGFDNAYNVQLAVDTKSRFIVGVDVINKNNDFGQLSKMFEQVKNKYNKNAEQWLVDQGYLDSKDLLKVQKEGCKVYVYPRDDKNCFLARENEELELGEWRERMGTQEAKEIYKDRASNSEWANAGMRNRGLRQLLVRGIKSVKSCICLHVLTHNILRAVKCGYAW